MGVSSEAPIFRKNFAENFRSSQELTTLDPLGIVIIIIFAYLIVKGFSK